MQEGFTRSHKTTGFEPITAGAGPSDGHVWRDRSAVLGSVSLQGVFSTWCPNLHAGCVGVVPSRSERRGRLITQHVPDFLASLTRAAILSDRA